MDIPDMAKRWGWKDAVIGWWEDWPLKRREFWDVLLFQPGQGWLRWAVEQGETIDHAMMEVDHYHLAPPLRRAWWYVRGWLQLPYLMFVGYKVHDLWTAHDAPKRQRLTFTEAVPSLSANAWMKDDQRYADLWGWNWKIQRKRKRERERRKRAAQ